MPVYPKDHRPHSGFVPGCPPGFPKLVITPSGEMRKPQKPAGHCPNGSPPGYQTRRSTQPRKAALSKKPARPDSEAKPNPFIKSHSSGKYIEKQYAQGALKGLEVLESTKPPSTSEKAQDSASRVPNTASESKRDDDVHPLILEGRIRQRLKRPARVSNGGPPTALSQIWTYFVIKDGTGNSLSLANAKPFGVSVKTDFEESRPLVTLRPTPKVPAQINPLSIIFIMANDQKADAITTEQIHGAMTLAGDIVHSKFPSEYLRYVEVELSALVKCLTRLGVRVVILPALNNEALQEEWVRIAGVSYNMKACFEQHKDDV